MIKNDNERKELTSEEQNAVNGGARSPAGLISFVCPYCGKSFSISRASQADEHMGKCPANPCR